ncbi:glycosyltransferase [Dactylosporangium sp. NPDC050688]|uniref:glycosyltransferase n=1 Tax=Dactylosporangium sp. NPDC050688 TaxID=3157217 RepID=UPI00340DD807
MRVAHFCDSHAGRSDGVAISVAATVHLLRVAGHDVQLYQPGPLLRGSGEPCGVRSVPVPLRNVRIGLPRFSGMPRVLRRLPDARLVMLGVRQQRQAVLRLARRAGVAHALRLVRPVPHASMAGYYRMADVLAFASTTDTQGLVLAEAEAQGLPVVLADAALAGTHRLSAAPDADAFGAAVTRVLTDLSLHRRVAEAGRAAAEAYSARHHLDHLLRAYRAAQAAHTAQGVASASVGASLAARTAG